MSTLLLAISYFFTPGIAGGCLWYNQSKAPPLSRRGPIFYLPSSDLACACVSPIAASCSLFSITPANVPE